MIDIHSHILPGIDDGADTIETSIQMARLAINSGTSIMIATPHFNCTYGFKSYKEVIDRYEQLVNTLKVERLDLDLLLGMEVYASEEVADFISKGRLLTLNKSKYILLEYSFREDLSLIYFLIEELINQGLSPIIAHPERYPYVQRRPRMVYEWLELGCHLQLNKGSILGRFGSSAYDTAIYLMSKNLVSFIASDAHGSVRRTTDLAKVFDFVSRAFSKEYADLLMKDNPKKLLKNQEVRRSTYEII